MNRPIYLFLLLTIVTDIASARPHADSLRLFAADNPRIQYTGRIDFSDKTKPRIWAPGVYIATKFKGARCEILINDEASGSNHNYLEIAIDDRPHTV